MLGYLVLSGITTGALYALVALGVVIVFKATGTVNFAHGDLFMIGGFLAFTFHVLMGLPYLVALALAVAAGFGIGILTDRIAFRPLMRANLVSLVLATVGFSFILKGIARSVWGGKADLFAFPPLISPDPIFLGPLIIIPQQLVAIGGAALVMGAFAAFFRLTRIGKMMQATADNPKAATLVGIRTDRVYMYAFGVGAAVAASAAVLMAPLTLLYPDIGFVLFIKGFAAAVLGGLSSLPGAVVGGLVVGVVEALAGGYINSSFLEVSAFVVIMVVLVLRPTGLFGATAVRRV
ncbi:MAG: branched-chain amino acid ABC transporter permease [Alphaproteobacteria bacterium]|nr:branched-chain amino acid ABC transporter permease [Alphaproteobacteria bacterium]